MKLKKKEKSISTTPKSVEKGKTIKKNKEGGGGRRFENEAGTTSFYIPVIDL